MRRQGDDGQLRAAVQHFFVGDLRIQKTYVQRHVRILARERAQQRRQAMQADVVAGRQAKATADFAVEVGQGAAGIVQYVEDLIGTWQQCETGLGQPDLATETIEQAHVQLLFQCGDAFADRRLGQVQPVGRQRETTGFGNGDKSVEVGKIHARAQRSRLVSIPEWNPLDEKYEFE